MSKSPIKFFIPGGEMMSGLMGNNQMLANNTNATAVAAAKARNAARNIQPPGSGLIGAIGAGLNHSGAGGGSNIGLGGRTQTINDAGFNAGTQNIMGGIFGNVNARQNSLGASGIYALKKHLSPVKNEDKLTAYKDVAKEDTPGYDDGAGGFDYEAKDIANTNTPGYTDKEAEAEFNRMKYITDASIKKGAGAVITVPKNKK
tara:strand:+ start:194 stop:799 length:606 start_codon:yes stop_codon:yes gene_type:complete